MKTNTEIKNKALKFLLLFFILILSAIWPESWPIKPLTYFPMAKGAAPLELKGSIDKKTQELLEINQQIQATQKKIEETQSESKTLKKEITKTDNEISQISLGIRSSEILIDRFKLEIEDTQYDIADIEEKIGGQKEAVSETLREIQKKDKETPLIIFLKNKSLAGSVFETQNLISLSDNLITAVNELQILKDELSEKIETLSNSKQKKEKEGFNLKNKKIIVEDSKKEKQTLLERTKNQEKIYQQSLTTL